MNIFFLSALPDECAAFHCDKHVVKMILETAQILCSVHHKLMVTTESDPIPYRKTHVNHPCVIWAAESLQNYLWLVQLGRELAKEYSFRYSEEGKASKTHKSAAVIEWAARVLPPLPSIGLTPPRQAMPDQYKVKDDPVAAYRAYYLGEKTRMLKYKRRQPPAWIAIDLTA